MRLRPPVIDGGKLEENIDGGEYEGIGLQVSSRSVKRTGDTPEIEYLEYFDVSAQIETSAAGFWETKFDLQWAPWADVLDDIVFTSLDPSVGTVDQNGQCTHVSSGQFYVNIRSEKGKYSHDFLATVGTYETVTKLAYFTSDKPNTLMREVSDSLSVYDTVTKDDEDVLPFYSTVPSNSNITLPKGGVNQYERNPDLWCADLVPYLTGLSVGIFNSDKSYIYRGPHLTMITDRIGVSCRHLGYWPQDGRTMLFLDADNNTHEATVVESQRVIGYKGYPDPEIGIPDQPDLPTDISVVLLDRSLPASIHRFRYFDFNSLLEYRSIGPVVENFWSAYPAPIWGVFDAFPKIWRNQFGLVSVVNGLSPFYDGSYRANHPFTSLNGGGIYGVSGDSGSAGLTLLEDELFLMWTMTGPGGGAHHSGALDGIQTAINELMTKHGLIPDTLSIKTFTGYLTS